LFAGYPPERPVDLEDMRTQMILLARADRATMNRLYPPEWYEARRNRQAEAEAAELADRLLGRQPSHRDTPDRAGRG